MPQIFENLCNKFETIKELERENQTLRHKLVSQVDACSARIYELERTNKILQHSLALYDKSFKAEAGEIVSQAVKKWHAPFSLPLKLAVLWFREVWTFPPRALGGKNYIKVIEAYEYNGFDEVEKLLAKTNTTPFIKASAWTCLARYLQIKDMKEPMLFAAQRACEINPRDFRYKWYALKLNEAGKTKEADIILDALKDKIFFSDTEEKTRYDILLNAVLEGENNIRKNVITPQGSKINFWEKENERLAKICLDSGVELCIENLGKNILHDPAYAAMRLLAIADELENKSPELAFQLAEYALQVHKSLANIKIYFRLAQKSGHLLDACDAINLYSDYLSNKKIPNNLEYNILKSMLDSQTWQLELLHHVPEKNTDICLHPLGKICYVLHNSLPYSSGGYATRSQGIAEGLAACGYEVVAVTRPGYPLDLSSYNNMRDVKLSDKVSGIAYERIIAPQRKFISPKEYALQAADALEQKFKHLRPSLVIAASNHTTALPALIAARRLQIPFIYEVRGLWEITHLSREKSYGDSSGFIINKILEAEVCNHADHVFTLTNGLKNELIDRGVSQEKISLAPNACDADKFKPRARDEKLAVKLGIPDNIPVIGYIGTFVVYEGLDDLTSACAMLKNEGFEFRLLLVGNENASGKGHGTISAEIQRIAQENDFASWLIMPGRVPHDEVGKYYSLIDIAPFTRKPWPVCEIVSPMKPLEAMAMEKAVVVSSVGALSEMIKDGETGLIFQKGNVLDIAEKLKILLTNPAKRTELGKNSRKFILKERTWAKVCNSMSKKLADI